MEIDHLLQLIEDIEEVDPLYLIVENVDMIQHHQYTISMSPEADIVIILDQSLLKEARAMVGKMLMKMVM